MTTCTADLRLVDAGQLGWLPDVAKQIADEAGLQLTADIEDLVAIAYVGMLDTRTDAPLTRDTLLRRCRANLIVWVWELGTDHQPLPRDRTRPDNLEQGIAARETTTGISLDATNDDR